MLKYFQNLLENYEPLLYNKKNHKKRSCYETQIVIKYFSRDLFIFT